MSQRLRAAAAAVTLLMGGAAEASESEEVETVAPEESEDALEKNEPALENDDPSTDAGLPQWALVASVGFVGTYTEGAGIGPLMPALGGGFERRLSGSTWLLLDAFGSLQSTHESLNDARSHWFWGALGVRHGFTPPELVEVSIYGALEGQYAYAGNETGDTHRGWGVGLTGGFILDKQLNDWFGLRFQTALLSGGYHRSQWGPGRDQSVGGWHVNLRADPTFGMRVLF